eukprot:5333572-Pyramimonas_sp.AAC.1
MELARQEGEGAGRRWSARASVRVSGRDRDAACVGPQLPARLRHDLSDSRVSRLGDKPIARGGSETAHEPQA